MKYFFTAIILFTLAGCATAPRQTGGIAAPYREAVSCPVPLARAGYEPGTRQFAWPVRGEVISFFGSKFDRSKNKGIDIMCSIDTDVRASHAGKVVFCDDKFKGYGKTVIIDHGNDFQTVYAYNSSILVKVGDAVEQNSVIARSGRSGRAKVPSLHFEIRRSGEGVNPLSYLS